MGKKKALLYGVGSYENRGVEALVASTIQLVDQKYDDVTIASYHLDYNTKYYNDSHHHYINHYRTYEELEKEEQEKIDYFETIPFDYQNFENIYERQVIDAMDDVDICISIGGDNYCYDSNNWLYNLTRRAKEKNKLSVLWGASLFEKIDDFELIDNLKQFDLLLIRESISYHELKKYISDDKLLLAPDPAFGLSPKKIHIPNWYSGRDVVGINLSPLTIKDDDQYDAFLKFMDYLLKETHYSISLIPHVLINGNDDRDILNKIYKKYQKEDRVRLEDVEKLQYQEIKYLISHFKFMIAARTHLSISAYSQLIPTLVIGYSVKSKGIAKDLFGSYDDYIISKNNIRYDELLKKFKFLEEHSQDIKDTLTKKMETYVPDAKNLLNMVLDRIHDNQRRQICDEQDCIGCSACYHICPHQAISLVHNEEGFLVPRIDLQKCTGCNLCRKVCPILNKQQNEKFDSKCYAAKNKNKEVVSNSSSGGVFSVIASSFLKSGGIVYGAAFQEGKTKHVRIDRIEDLEKIMGSKYTQSSMIDILSKVKDDLEAKKKVLFSGTSCQVSALQSFLKKDYSNLYCVSVICHGVMNDETWNRYAVEMGISKGDYDSYRFRDKANGWNHASVSYIKNDRKIAVEFEDDPFMYLFLKNMALRESCYHCQFKGLENINSDIILGDYWGIHLCHPDFFDEKGVSCVIVNSTKGEHLLKECSFFDKCDVIDSDIQNIYQYNITLNESVKRPNERNRIFDDMRKNELSNITLIHKLKNENGNLKENVKVLEPYVAETTALREELSMIYHSRRWTIPTKIIDSIKRKK